MTAIDDRLAGLGLPGEPAYEAATAVFNLAGPAEPAAALTAHSVEEVRAAVRHAAAEAVPVRAHTTGHASTTGHPMRGALLIRTRLRGGVEVDTERRIARIPAGTLWGEVVDAVAPHGLAAPHGSSPTVGVVGYLLRGGISFYSRRHGLAVNSVRAVELVTADGELRRVDAAADPELFWALRGGGGGFGVVTAVEVALFPAAEVVTGSTFWPAEHAAALLRAWRRWTLDAPWAAGTSFRVLNLPAVPEVPPVLSGRTVVSVDGVVLCEPGDVGEPGAAGEPGCAGGAAAQRLAEDLLGPLRAVAEPLVDTWQLTAPADLLRVHLDPPDPVPIVGDHLLLDEIGDEGEAALLRVVGEGSGSPLVVAGLRQLGGAFAVPDPAGGALSHLTARFAYSGSGVPLGGLSTADILAHCATVRAALTPWDTGRTAPSFVERVDQPQGHLTSDQIRTLDQIRLRIDPTGLFRGDITPNATTLH